MITLKKTVAIVLFFSLVIIASCITFNNNNSLEKYNYDNAVYADDINPFNGFMIYEAKPAINKQNQYILLFKQNQLKHILSNNPRNNFVYDYTLLAEGIHLLHKEYTNRFERGGGVTYSKDSILCSENVVVKKHYTYGGRFATNIKCTIYKKVKDSIMEYRIQNVNTSLGNSILSLLYSLNSNNTLKTNDYNLTKQYPVDTEEKLQAFFKHNILTTKIYFK